MIVVSDTSPLTNLAAVGHLHLLERLFGAVQFPRAVYDEVVVRGAGRPGADEMRASSWITTREVSNRPLVSALELELDAGEAEAIALAVEVAADVVLMDERLGHQVALRMGLRPLGVIGMLLDCKRSGFISQVAPLLDRLRNDAGFRISDALYNHARALADE